MTEFNNINVNAGSPIGLPRISKPPFAKVPEHSFESVLQKHMVKFSNHAETRLKQRGINLSPEQLAKIANVLDQVAAKGAKDTLILIKDMALIANVKNKTIVTAIDKDSMQDKIFTQIDSAVIIS